MVIAEGVDAELRVQVLGFTIGPYLLGVELPYVYQVVPASAVDVPRTGMYRYENMPMLALDALFPVQGRGDAFVILWHEDAVGACRIDQVHGLEAAAMSHRYPVPAGWLRPGRGWVQAIYFPPDRARPLFIIDVVGMLRAAQQTAAENPP